MKLKKTVYVFAEYQSDRKNYYYSVCEIDRREWNPELILIGTHEIEFSALEIDSFQSVAIENLRMKKATILDEAKTQSIELQRQINEKLQSKIAV